MNDEKQLKIIWSVAVSAIAVVVFITAITVATDLLPPLKNWLKAIFTHHWIGKSALATLLFAGGAILCYAFPHKASMDGLIKRLDILFWAVIAGSIVITLFFVWEAFWK